MRKMGINRGDLVCYKHFVYDKKQYYSEEKIWGIVLDSLYVGHRASLHYLIKIKKVEPLTDKPKYFKSGREILVRAYKIKKNLENFWKAEDLKNKHF